VRSLGWVDATQADLSVVPRCQHDIIRWNARDSSSTVVGELPDPAAALHISSISQQEGEKKLPGLS